MYIENLERQITAYTRSDIIDNSIDINPKQSQSNDTYNAVTKTGLLATISDNQWQKILLAKQEDGAEISFNNPNIKLTQAFESNDLFLVIANDKYLGDFKNKINIEDWQMQADVGNGILQWLTIFYLYGNPDGNTSESSLG